MWFGLATVTSQALKNDVISFVSTFKQFYVIFISPQGPLPRGA